MLGEVVVGEVVIGEVVVREVGSSGSLQLRKLLLGNLLLGNLPVGEVVNWGNCCWGSCYWGSCVALGKQPKTFKCVLLLKIFVEFVKLTNDKHFHHLFDEMCQTCIKYLLNLRNFY